MTTIHFHDNCDNTTHKVDLCDRCYEGIAAQAEEFEVCEPCESKMRAAGMPMRQPKGICNGCLKDRLLTHEFLSLRYCKSCAAKAARMLGVPSLA